MGEISESWFRAQPRSNIWYSYGEGPQCAACEIQHNCPVTFLRGGGNFLSPHSQAWVDRTIWNQGGRGPIRRSPSLFEFPYMLLRLESRGSRRRLSAKFRSRLPPKIRREIKGRNSESKPTISDRALNACLRFLMCCFVSKPRQRVKCDCVGTKIVAKFRTFWTRVKVMGRVPSPIWPIMCLVGR